MGKLFLAFAILLILVGGILKIIAIGQTETVKHRKVQKVELPPDRTILLEAGRKFINFQNVRWDQTWILTQPMVSTDTPQTYRIDLYEDNKLDPTTRLIIKESK